MSYLQPRVLLLLPSCLAVDPSTVYMWFISTIQKLLQAGHSATYVCLLELALLDDLEQRITGCCLEQEQHCVPLPPRGLQEGLDHCRRVKLGQGTVKAMRLL